MKLKELCAYLDAEVPLSFQEEYDNSGLQIGQPEKELTSALLTLDVTEQVLDEAVNKHCDIVISHHPLIFKGIKRISGNAGQDRIIVKAIKKDIAVYSSHTNLDMVSKGVSNKMALELGLVNVKVLKAIRNQLLKLVTFIPEDHLEKVQNAIFRAGAGVVGNYDRCGFVVKGTGSYRGGEETKPFAGEKGKMHFEKEVRFETILYSHFKDRVVGALLETHPYEEVAYDIYSLANENSDAGLGCTGDLPEPLGGSEFLALVSKQLGSYGIRYSKIPDKPLKKIAVCGGSGSSLLEDAIRYGADAFVTGDIKYHTFLDAESRILLVDCGHYESEKFSVQILYDLIVKKFPKFAVRFSEVNTNPINYL